LGRPAVRDVAVLLPGHDVVDSPAARLRLGEADGRDLGSGEDPGGDGAVVALAQVVGVEQVVLDDARFVVGQVLELEGVGDVAERPHAGCAGALVDVGDHHAGLVDLDTAGCEVEEVGVGAPPGRDQQQVRLDRAGVAGTAQLQAYAAGGRHLGAGNTRG